MSREIAKPKQKQPYRIKGKLKLALDRMVFGTDGGKPLPYDEAARSVGYPVRSMRRALERQEVRSFLRTQRQVFRAALTAATPHRLAEIRDSASNAVASVSAARMLEELDTDMPLADGGALRRPGVTIVVVQQAAPVHVEPRTIAPGHVIDAEPVRIAEQLAPDFLPYHPPHDLASAPTEHQAPPPVRGRLLRRI